MSLILLIPKHEMGFVYILEIFEDWTFWSAFQLNKEEKRLKRKKKSENSQDYFGCAHTQKLVKISNKYFFQCFELGRNKGYV